MLRGKVLLALLFGAVFSSTLGFWLLTDRPASATHFRPETCLTDHYVNWDLCYTTVHRDGLVVDRIFFKDKKVLHDIRIPHVYVDYVTFFVIDEFTDNLTHSCWRSDFANEFVLSMPI